MAHRDPQAPWRAQQMEQYANSPRQYGDRHRHPQDGDDARDGGARSGRGGFSRHDPVQSGYGRAGAPDVYGQPSGGYPRAPWHGHHGGYDHWRGDRHGPGYAGQDYRGAPPGDDGHDWQRDRSKGSFQGGSGGYRPDTGPHAGSQTHGRHGDQLSDGTHAADERQGRDAPDDQQ
ncbi:hypothetical protein [Pseudorhodoferax sp.]|uniref:hypothetical protein n=1 Tax=Pseudorhodoferax sp. TaxID=1993553 RepID=UPI0039E592D6